MTFGSYSELRVAPFPSGHDRVEIWFVAAWSFFISRVRSEAKMFLLDSRTPTRKSKKKKKKYGEKIEFRAASSLLYHQRS